MKGQSTKHGFNQANQHQTVQDDEIVPQSQEAIDAYFSAANKKKWHFIRSAISLFILSGCFIAFILWLFFKVIL